MMEYGKILKRAWEITKKYKFLWWLGFLALLTEGGMGSPVVYNTSLPSSLPSQDEISYTSQAANVFKNVQSPENVSSFPPMPPAPTRQKTSAPSSFSPGIAPLTEAMLISFALLFGLAFLIFLFYISYSAKAGLFLAAKKLKSKEDDGLSFGKLFKAGKAFAWRLFIFNLLIFTIVAIVAIILIIPSVILIAISQNTIAIIMFVALMIVAVLIIIAAVIVVSLVKKLGERTIVLEGARAVKAIKLSFEIIKKNPGPVLLTWLIEVGIQIGYGIAVAIGTIIIAIVLFIIGTIFYLVFKTAGLVVFVSLAVFGLVMLLITIASIFITFTSSFWTISFESIRENGLTKN